jgi:transcriptional regulator with XRE-family HTH domain
MVGAQVTAGQRLRSIRERLGLTIRDVEAATLEIAKIKDSDEFAINLSRLSDFETKGVVPSVFRMYSLAIIYKIEFLEIVSWYGIDFDESHKLFKVVSISRTHKAELLQHASKLHIPIKTEPTFDLNRTSNLGRLIERWGVVPLVFLQELADAKYSYGYIGDADFTMYPLIMPGSFIQIDESKDKVLRGMWRSERDRPIYFVESREGFTCCWCEIQGRQIVLQPHPLSPVQIRTLRHPQDAEVIGQVVGIAMNLHESALEVPIPTEHSELTSDG